LKKNTSYFHPIYFPTKVAIVDDDPDYLQQVSLLVNDDVICDLFTSPSEALKVVQDYDENNDRFTRHYTQQWRENLDDTDLGVAANNPHQFINDDRRFDLFSVMVIDYAMPEMSGLDLCKQLSNPWIKKILVTGKADLDVAVQAFNQGLIDQFIRKDEGDVDILLNSAIDKLSHQYFTDRCAPNNEVLFREAPYLFENSFVRWFTHLCHDHGIVEYYLKGDLLNSVFLLVTRTGKIKLLFLQTPEQSKAQYEIALDNEKIPAELLDAIYTRDVIPCLFGRGVFDSGFKDIWYHYAFPAKKFNGYVYAMVDANDLPEFKVEHVGYSYNQFYSDFFAELVCD